MEQATKIVSKLAFNSPSETQDKQDNWSKTEKIINQVFEQMKAIRPAWKLSLPDKSAETIAKKQWTKAFIKNGILSFEQLRQGFDKARAMDDKYFPAPGTFIKWCTPQSEDFGLPKTEVAYLEACRHSHNPSRANWSHEAVYQAAKATGWFELKTLEERQALPLFTHNYEVVTRRVLAGESISDIPKALPGQTMKTPTEQHQAYHDAQQQAHIKQAGLNQLTNSSEAITKIRQMIKKGGN